MLKKSAARLLRACKRRLRIGSAPLAPLGAGADPRHAFGVWGENIAAEHLRRNGFAIIGRRAKEYRDEIDIIAEHRVRGAKQIVFVEVKTRKNGLMGGGLAAVDKRKRHNLCRAAARYLRRNPRAAFRFDIIEVTGSSDSAAPPQIRHIENAFPMERRYFFSG